MEDRQQVEPKKSRWKLYVAGGVAAYVAATVGVVLYKHPPKLSTPSDATVDKAEEDFMGKERVASAKGEATIRATLKDPASAEFGTTFSHVSHGEQVACGTVNARNSFGAMAGTQRWIVIPGQDISMIQSFDNASKVARLWNRYCASGSDSSVPAPTEFLGVTFGARVPASLRPYDGTGKLYVFRDGTAQTYLGTLVGDVWFTVEHGRVDGAGATTKGRDAYERLRSAMFAQYGMPTSDGGHDDPRMRWEWSGRPLAQLFYNANHDQTSIMLEEAQRHS